MTKPELELGIGVIRYTFEKLPEEDKLRVVAELERETRAQRWGKVVQKVRSRLQKNPLSQKEIDIICQEARRTVYARKYKSSN